MTSRLRVAALILGAVAILFVVSGSGGYSTATTDRAVAVDVVSDEDAFLGIERDVVAVDNGTVEVLTLTNQFPVEMTVTTEPVRTENESPAVAIKEDELILTPGETREIQPAVDCNNTTAGSNEIVIGISGTGPGSTIELSRSVEISCT